MLSSPPDPLKALTTLYDEAFAALQANDLERVHVLVTEADRALARIGRQVAKATPTRREELERAYGRLMAVLTESQETTRRDLAEARAGRRALKAYGAADPSGRSLDWEG